MRFAQTYQDLADRLAAEPNVVGVTFADRLPLQPHPFRRIELDHGAAEPEVTGVGHRVSSANVATDFLATFGVSVLAGRMFGSGDAQAEESPVLVNQSFVDGVLGGRNPIGRRIRYTFFQESDLARAEEVEPEPWHEIVGLVPDMGMAIAPDPRSAGIYHPAAPGDSYPIQIAVHMVGDPGAFIQRLREISATLNPLLRVNDAMLLEQGASADLRLWIFFRRTSFLGGGFALILSLAGIFSAMSFAVSRKTREIGIRAALGSNRRRIVVAIFKRPAIQVGFGLLGGAVLSEALASAVVEGGLVPKVAAMVLIYSTITACVCMLACVVPTRRALAVEPAEALRGE